MKTEIKYLELKSGFAGNGPAWVGLVSFSKSGKTIYFDGKAFQRIGSDRISGNFYEIEGGDEYWISGVKKDMSDRHKFGGGPILIENRILGDYLQIIGRSQLPKTGYELTEVDTEIPIQRIHELENERIDQEEFDDNLHFKQPNELTIEELEFVIEDLFEEEKEQKFKKARRSYKKARIEFENELVKRRTKNMQHFLIQLYHKLNQSYFKFMINSLEKITSFIDQYDRELGIKFRIQTKSNCDEKYRNYIRGSRWNYSLSIFSNDILDFGLEPTPHSMIKQIQILPIEERHMGALMPSKVIDHTEKICNLLDELNIKYELQDVLICIQ